MAAPKKASGATGDGAGRNDEEASKFQTKLLKALSHPTRVEILDLLNAGEWSPNELSRHVGEGLSHISYHVKVLKDYELIELTRTEPRRGAVEHFYRALVRPHVPKEVSQSIPKVAQRMIGNRILDNISADVSASLEAGTFYARNDWHIGWIPVVLDDEGRCAAEKLADKFAEDIMELAGEAKNRIADKGNDEILTTAVLLLFGSKDGPQSSLPMWRRGRDKAKREGRSKKP